MIRPNVSWSGTGGEFNVGLFVRWRGFQSIRLWAGVIGIELHRMDYHSADLGVDYNLQLHVPFGYLDVYYNGDDRDGDEG